MDSGRRGRGLKLIYREMCDMSFDICLRLSSVYLFGMKMSVIYSLTCLQGYSKYEPIF